MFVTDKEAGAGSPTSKFLRKEELAKAGIDQNHFPRRLNYLFKYKRPIDIPEKEAKLLIEKYETLYHSDELANEIVAQKIENEPIQEEKIINEVKIEQTKESSENDVVRDFTRYRSDS